MISLISVYDTVLLNPPETEVVLFSLLSERKPYQNISHKQMPTFEAHKHFVRSKPYKDWFLIIHSEMQDALGSIYLTQNNEIGIFLFDECTGKGYGSEALDLLTKSYYSVKEFYANIAPNNSGSICFFCNRGFTWFKTVADDTGIIQYTYKKVNPYYETNV